MKKQPILITDAARSPDEQFRSRQIRYVTMMGLRAVCLVAGAVLISVRPPLLALWLILCAAGMVFLPWAAVLIANDRPARSKAERAAAVAEQQKSQPTLAQHTPEQVEYMTIDADFLDSGERWAPTEGERRASTEGERRASTEGKSWASTEGERWASTEPERDRKQR